VTTKPTVFITGANRGIGLELVRQYAAAAWRVIATCRNPIGLGELAKLHGEIEVHGLEVTDATQATALAKELDGTAIDVLINNAGVYGPNKYSLDEVDEDAWVQTLRVNVMAPLRISNLFTPHVAASTQRKIITVTSKMGSIGDNASGGVYIYRSSKSAVNAVMRSLSHEVRDQGIIVTLLHPGWVKTDMGGPNALISVEESVTGMRGVIANLNREQSGSFLNYDGTEIPW
jgi:NAD(P)-dependent dehydrogenase (short-subunit alcohol dehydrogenase family)